MGTWKATADLQIYTQMFFACAVRPTSSLLCQSNAKLFTFILYDDVSILVKGVTVSHPWNHRIEKWFDKCENDVNCLIWPLQSLYLNSFWEILNPSDKQICSPINTKRIFRLFLVWKQGNQIDVDTAKMFILFLLHIGPTCLKH